VVFALILRTCSELSSCCWLVSLNESFDLLADLHDLVPIVHLRCLREGSCFERSITAALAACSAAIDSGADNYRAGDVALAKARAAYPELTEEQLRAAMTIKLAVH
jgi:hypothetical protein